MFLLHRYSFFVGVKYFSLNKYVYCDRQMSKITKEKIVYVLVKVPDFLEEVQILEVWPCTNVVDGKLDWDNFLGKI